MYYKEARKKAKIEVKKGLEADEEVEETNDKTSGDAG